MRQRKIIVFIILLFFTNCNKKAENIVVFDKSEIINKLNDTVICKIELRYGYIYNYIDTLPPDSSLRRVKRCCDGVNYIEIYKKNNPENIYIKFSPSGSYNYKLNPYDCDYWGNISRCYSSEKNGDLIYYTIIEKSYFYLSKENVIHE